MKKEDYKENYKENTFLENISSKIKDVFTSVEDKHIVTDIKSMVSYLVSDSIINYDDKKEISSYEKCIRIVNNILTVYDFSIMTQDSRKNFEKTKAFLIKDIITMKVKPENKEEVLTRRFIKKLIEDRLVGVLAYNLRKI